MRTLNRKQKTVAALAIGALGVAGTGVAYAYWTTTGSGSGSATNASANGTLVLTADWNDAALFPGGSQTVTFTAANAGATNLYVTTVHLESVSSNAAGCDVGDFTMPDVTSGQVISANSTETLTATGTLSFANSEVTQDACKGAEITLNISSN